MLNPTLREYLHEVEAIVTPGPFSRAAICKARKRGRSARLQLSITPVREQAAKHMSKTFDVPDAGNMSIPGGG